VKAPLGEGCVRHESKIDAGQPDELGREIGLTAEQDESPRIIVDAVTVLGSRVRVPGVLPETHVVCHPLQVLEARCREGLDDSKDASAG
jgi:hypothetical protein